jgi:D-alanyl-D-alanine carboxypeptidase/D-alanyl-D-alanine-endopeptidase (penicillin-binding protein 4)
MEDEGVLLTGKLFRADTLPRFDWRPVDVHRSDLLTTLEVINKRSQNFYAESLLKGLGARHCGDGDWNGGLQAVQEFARRIGLEEQGLNLTDGSGMSRNNRATPRHLTALLRAMYFHRWGKEFLRTLPYSGEPDLSWKKRLATPPYRGNVFAKTGTLNGVSTLSGYAKAKSGRLYAFSILCNQNRSNWEAKQVQDRIVRALIDQG